MSGSSGRARLGPPRRAAVMVNDMVLYTPWFRFREDAPPGAFKALLALVESEVGGKVVATQVGGLAVRLFEPRGGFRLGERVREEYARLGGA